MQAQSAPIKSPTASFPLGFYGNLWKSGSTEGYRKEFHPVR